MKILLQSFNPVKSNNYHKTVDTIYDTTYNEYRLKIKIEDCIHKGGLCCETSYERTTLNQQGTSHRFHIEFNFMNPAIRLLNEINCPGYLDRDRTVIGTDRFTLIDLIEISALTGISHWRIQLAYKGCR